MALDRLTKVDGGGISTTSDYRVGIITATKFVGPIEGDVTGSITATDGTFSGNVTIGGTLTYEDVTNIDSVGIITAQKDIHVGAGLSVVGVTTTTDLTVEKSGNLNVNIKSTGGWGALEVGGASAAYIDLKKPFSDDFDFRFMHDGNNSYITTPNKPFFIDVLGNTAIEIGPYGASALKYNNNTKLSIEQNGVNVTGIVTATSADINGDLDVDGHTNLDNVSIAGVTTFSDDVTFTGSSNNIVFDKSSNHIRFNDGAQIKLGTSNDASIRHDGSNTWIQNSTGYLYLDASSTGIRLISQASWASGAMAAFNNNGSVQLYYDASQKFYTTASGINVIGTTDTDGLVVSGVSTFSGDLIPDTAGAVDIGSANKEIGDVYIADSKHIYLGNEQDLDIRFDSSNAAITLDTGTLSIINYANNEDVKILSDNSSGGVVDYIVADGSTGEVLLNHYGSQKLATSTTGITVTGTVTATSFAGDGSNLTGISGVTINNNANNRLITGSGSANTLEAESTLTYDGNQLNVVQTTSSSDSKVVIANSNTPGSGNLRLEFQYGTGTTEGTNRFRFGYVEGYRQGGSNDGGLIFGTKPNNAGAPTERLRIDSSGFIRYAPSNMQIFADSSDGSDDHYLNLSGGGACSQTRGAQVVMYGNEYSNHQGKLVLMAGNAGSVNGKIQMYTGGTERLAVQEGGVLSQRVNSYARLSHGILEITSSSSPSQLKIKTNIPYSSAGGSHAESVTIRGFRYGGRDTVDIQICWHVYADQFYNRIASSSGGWAPLITLGVENNKVVIHFDSLGYWHKIYVSDYYSPFLNEDYARGWSYDFTAISGDSGTPVNTVPYKNDWGGLEYNSDHAVGTNPDRHLKIVNGDLQIGTSGHGVNFQNFATSGNPSSNLLDDYEEGSWTPAYSRPNMTLGNAGQFGRYTKIGRVVHIVGKLYTTSENGSSSGGPILVTGLPFTVRETRCALSVRPASWSNDHPSFATFELNQTFFELLEEVEGNPSGSSDLGGSRFAGGTGNYLWFGGSYFTDS